jgi:hypothetical protein
MRATKVALVLAALGLGVLPAAADPPSCYELTVGQWTVQRGNVAVGVYPEPEWKPPSRIRLEIGALTPKEAESAWTRSDHLVRPDGQAVQYWLFAVGEWHQEPKGTIRVYWSGGYGGVTLQFRPDIGSTGVGTVEVESDNLDQPSPSAPVRVKAVPCALRRGKPANSTVQPTTAAAPLVP